MKIGFLGNTNNYPFILARALRRMGHEILFIVDSPERLYRPEYRYDDITLPYPEWVYDVSPVSLWDFAFPTPKRAKIISLLKNCDAVILNGLGPSLLLHIDRPAVILLTGSDLEYYGNLQTIDELVTAVHRKPVFLRRMWRKYVYTRLVSAQRAGIRSATTINYVGPGLIPKGDALLKEIGIQDSQWIFFLMTDLEKIHPEPLPHNQPLRTFCATRLTWKKPLALGTSELDYKGSDIMIRGLGLFARTTHIPLDIRLVKKGMHVAETMHLIEEEGFAEQVTWLEEMSQLGVWAEYKQADIIFEQFGLSVIGMAGLDAMATGRPIIANGRPEIMEKRIGVPAPICQAVTPEEVCAQLQRLVLDPAERERVGLLSRQYVEKYCSPEHAAQICLERLGAK
ncbi:glycosyltransferase family 4 protein [Microcoleus sp. FACHB-SPT15]|uniref:glycosyltransferase family 4 protein n=1 Tax=Microcoleus sp. FACHB-SPT15 TaxID=2692830 RepID=UPI00177C54A1|nr:glycosyltransferase family 4 protein [Microcoleus sp. FACHB-SPT15]MBD1806549.1 glycosyltransferase family 4 protein [Microcoleus sp. FACHB-SPT15]